MIRFQAGIEDMQKRDNEQDENKYLSVDIG